MSYDSKLFVVRIDLFENCFIGKPYNSVKYFYIKNICMTFLVCIKDCYQLLETI